MHTITLTCALKSAIIAHALQCYPRECCGLIVDIKGVDTYCPCNNTATDGAQFTLCAKDYAKAESLGCVRAIVHSHPNGEPTPSKLDKIQMPLHGVPWVIVALSNTNDAHFGVYAPCEYAACLIGRKYIHGVQDCYAIVRDFYSRELNIALPDFYRTDAWWEDATHAPLYDNNIHAAGFIDTNIDAAHLDKLQYGDVLLCRVGRTRHTNHAIIYLANHGAFKSEHAPSCIRAPLILHHPHNKQSVREPYSKAWANRVQKVIRHKSLM